KVRRASRWSAESCSPICRRTPSSRRSLHCMNGSGRRSMAPEGPVTTFDENKLRFRFGERWHVDKWDKCDVYTGGVGKLCGELTDPDGSPRREGTKAVDFVGVLDREKVYLLEVKDFRGHRVENKKRQERELPWKSASRCATRSQASS